MSSSISSFDDAAGASKWRAWLWTFAFVPIAFVLVCGFTILLDPYSTGRFSPIGRVDLATQNHLFGHAARVSDVTFDAAIVGNSHGLPFDPVRLSAATGRRFVQLSVLGLNPDEQLTIARAFVRNRQHQSPALVIVLDQSWCATDGVHNRIRGFFPAFLFESSNLEYVRSIITPDAVEAAGYRLLIIMGIAGDIRRRDGYAPIPFPDEWSAQKLAQLANHPRPTEGPASDATLPALTSLQALALKLDPQTRLVLFFTRLPVFALPAPGSFAAQRLESCKTRYREFAHARPHTALVDRMVDDGFARDMRNFGDIAHVHNRAAAILEQDVASVLRPMLAR